MLKVCLFVLSLIPFLSFSQSEIHSFTLQWDPELTDTRSINNGIEKVLFFKGSRISDEHNALPVYYVPVQVRNSGPYQARLTNAIYSPVAQDAFLKARNLNNTEALV